MSPKMLLLEVPTFAALLVGIDDKDAAGTGVLDPLELEPLLPLREAYDTEDAGLGRSASSINGDCGLALLL